MDTLTELMPDLLVFRVLRPLLPFAGVLVGWRLGRGDGESARKLARLLSVALFAGFLAAAVTGWFRTRIFDSSIHQWVGQDLIASTSFAHDSAARSTTSDGDDFSSCPLPVPVGSDIRCLVERVSWA
jgi:hypothetical protein